MKPTFCSLQLLLSTSSLPAARACVLAFGLLAASAKSAAVREVADRIAALKEIVLDREPAGLEFNAVQIIP